MVELPDPLRPGEVFEAMEAEIGGAYAFREAPENDRADCCRAGQLSSVGARPEPRSEVHRRTEEVVYARFCRTRVDAHTNADRRSVRPLLVRERALKIHCAPDRIGRICECGECAVA